MDSKIVKKFLNSTPQSIRTYTGIRNWENKSQSYLKTVYNNNTVLPHDKHAVYWLDKLHIGFRINSRQNMLKYEMLYDQNKQYDLSDFITIIPNKRSGKFYHISFAIVVEDVHAGYLHMVHTKRKQQCLLEIDNRVLYCQSPLWIISCIYLIARAFDLHFNNISKIEVARDSLENTYRKLSEVYYHSNRCNEYIHELTGDEPRYYYSNRVEITDFTDKNDPSNGTFIFGSNNSNTILRVYNKSKEIRDKDWKKKYIHEQHIDLLGGSGDVYRTEIAARSSAFCKTGILGREYADLTRLFDRSELPSIFFRMLSDKLTFKDLSTKHWNKSGNQKFDYVRIIPVPDTVQMVKMSAKATSKRFKHEEHINKVKFMINQYLDGDIGFSFLVDYIIRGVRKNSTSSGDFRKASKVVFRNHRNKVTARDRDRLNLLIYAMEKGVTALKMVKTKAFFGLL